MQAAWVSRAPSASPAIWTGGYWEHTGHHGNALVIMGTPWSSSTNFHLTGAQLETQATILLNQDAYIGKKKNVFKVQLPLGPDSNSLGSDSAVTM